MKTLARQQNKGGVWFQLSEENGTFYVFKRVGNYDGKFHGGIRYEWRYTDKTKDREEADKAFAKRLKSAGKR